MTGDMLGPYPLNSIITGDARELAKAIPDESVDLIFTDPVYDRIEDYRWLAEMAMRVLKPDRACVVFYGIGYLPETLDALRIGGLQYRWQLIGYITNEVKRRPAPPGKCAYKGLLWVEKGISRRYKFRLDIRAIPAFSSNSNYKWSKPPLIPSYYIEGLSNSSMIILDPFVGGGTIPAVCKMLGRRYLAFEIDPDTAEIARERVRNTQPPLSVPEPQQAAMFEEVK